jgi:hypothetical protein
MCDRGLCGWRIFLESGLGGRGLRHSKRWLQVIDDPVNYGMLRDEDNDLH